MNWLGLGCLGLVLLVAEAQAAVRTHYYGLRGNLSDAFGGPALVSGGGLVWSDGYHYFPGKGLSLSNAINPRHYSVVMLVAINDTGGYRKLIDFKNKSSDYGMYNLYGVANFYPTTQGTNTVMFNGITMQLVLTRNSSNAQVDCYINGTPQFRFSDTNEYAAFTSASNIAHFVVDDTTTTGAETSTGWMQTLEIFDGPLEATEVAEMAQRQPPRLNLTANRARLAISWTNLVYGFTLETAANPTPDAPWTAVTNPPVFNGLQQTTVITNTEQNGGAFFRLRK